MRPDQFFAKSGNDVSLIRHSRDVERISKDLGDDELNAASLLHDIGKISPAFQKSIGKGFSGFNWHFRLDIPHNILSLFFIDKRRLYERFGEESLSILSAIAFHHYRERTGDYLLKPLLLLETARELKANAIEISEALRLFDKELCLNGLLALDHQMVDGIIGGSSLLDMGFLIPPYKLSFSIHRFSSNPLNLRKMVRLAGFLKYSDHLASFLEDEGIGDFIPSEAEDRRGTVLSEMKIKGIPQSGIWQQQKMTDGNAILLAGAGSGKSFYALIWSGERPLIFTLPLRAAVNAMYSEVSSLFGESGTGLLHSDADLWIDERSDELSGFTLDLARQLSLPNIVTTGDQIFPSALKFPGYDRIYAVASRSSIVIDEVQAYSPTASAIVVKLIEDVAAMGGKFLLMTATLPHHIAEEIDRRCPADSKPELIDMYPELFSGVRKHRVRVEESALAESTQSILQRLRRGERILVIANTVKRAQEVYASLLKEADENLKESIMILHSRFTMAQRKELEEKVMKRFPNSKTASPGVLVSTQIVEASLDISLDCLYTDICPMDSLIQRMGRVLRYIRTPFEYSGEENIVVCVSKEDGEVKNAEVYNPTIVDRTLKALEDKASDESAAGGINRPLSELEKRELVDRVFSDIEGTDYYKEFSTALRILDSGWLSERKSDARRIFRDISQTAVIPANLAKQAVETAAELQDGEITWTEFKKRVVARLVVNVGQGSLWKRKTEKFSDLLENQGVSSKRLLRYARSIYVVEGLEYDIELGLT